MYCLITFGVAATYFFKEAADVNFMLSLMENWSFGFGAVITFLFTGYYAEKLGLIKPKVPKASKYDKK